MILHKCLAIFILMLALSACLNEDAKSSRELKEEASNVDYDFTKLSATMVYGQVFDIMNNPEKYVGKKFKIKGRYESEYIKALAQEFKYIVIEDALACCEKGIEIKFLNSNETPELSSSLTIEGIFTQENKNSHDTSPYNRYLIEVYNKY